MAPLAWGAGDNIGNFTFGDFYLYQFIKPKEKERGMKRVTFFLLLFLAAMVINAYAHPPSDIKITFDPVTKVLQAVIMHDVKDPAQHFIKTVGVGLNGKVVISQAISRQDNNESQTVSYLIPDAKAGDVLSVEGYCSISGKLEKEIKAQ